MEKFNPYNPYVEDKEQSKVENLKVESLDDLFEDVPTPRKEEVKEPEKVSVATLESKQEESSSSLNLNDFNDAPILPQEDDEYDLQKELEAKFDELFGPLDDE